MPKGRFSASQFVPTEFSTADEKAAFCNALLHFIESDWKESLFTKKFYTRLSMTFGYIAHYAGERDYAERRAKGRKEASPKYQIAPHNPINGKLTGGVVNPI